MTSKSHTKNRKISHIINPVIVDSSSNLSFAQPVTFETMKKAQRLCPPEIQVTLYSAQYPEDHPMIPDGYIVTEDLDRSILDFGTFKKPKKLPLIKDILDRLYQCSLDDYFIYSNVDISLQPYFYQAVDKIIADRYDAFIINHRTIPDHYTNMNEIPFMYAQLGKKHPGWDCFIFKRDLYPHFDLGRTFIGAGWFGRVMISNMACLAKKFKIFTDLHLTFHMGCPQVHKDALFDDYRYLNRKECRRILLNFEKKFGELDHSIIPGRFLRYMEKDKYMYARFENDPNGKNG